MAQVAKPEFLGRDARWRLKWTHPFTDGNGRTSRSLSCALLSMKLGYVLPAPDDPKADRGR
ncbi:Fic family protein [Mesorhizobium amorphae]|uniref:Fic family protein n=1 Tax=Mesorhizobium amorphae TaxID=71433 RepID=UPI001300C3A3